jgi:hypothetical protein
LDKNIDKEIDYILSKKSKCYEANESKENNTNKKFRDEMEIAALAIGYTQKANNMTGKYQSTIIGPTEDVNLGDFFIFRCLERFKNFMFIELKKLLDYFLEVNKETYNFIKASSFHGAIARYRLQIEIYSFFLQNIHNILKDFQIIKLVNNHHQRWWLEWVAPIRGLKPSIILSFSTYS